LLHSVDERERDGYIWNLIVFFSGAEENHENPLAGWPIPD
jgi:hypothetical protein